MNGNKSKENKKYTPQNLKNESNISEIENW